MKLFKGRRREEEAEAPPTQCEHVTLIPRWDSVDDIGKADAVTSYRCESCGAEFTLDEANRLRATERERVQEKLAG